jgi:hypothetical protein
MERVRLDNGQKVNAGLSIFDRKGKLVEELPEGATINYVSDNEKVAQWQPHAPNSIYGMVTTLNDDVGVANITGTVSWPDGMVKSDVLEVTVIHSAVDVVRFTVGTPEEEAAPA